MTIIVITNNTGNCGKSTLAKHLLKPRMGDSVSCIAYGHSRNAKPQAYADFCFDGRSAEDEVAARIFHDSAMKRNLLIDVGSSDMRNVNRMWDAFDSLHKRVDVYLVPCMPDPKQVADTITSIDTLLKRGVEASKIVVVRNNFNESDFFQRDAYKAIEEDSGRGGYKMIKTPVFSNGILGLVNRYSESLRDYANFKLSAPSTAQTEKDHNLICRTFEIVAFARRAENNLNLVYTELVDAMSHVGA